MEKQVLSIEQMQELQKLGMDISNASMCWAKCTKINSNKEWESYWHLQLNKESYGTKVPTFTLHDILGMFKRFHLEYPKKEENLYFLTVVFDWGKYRIEEGTTPLEAAFKMLKYIKENKLE